MFWTENKRIIKAGFVSFWRSGLVSVSSILVMVVALAMIASTIMLTAFMDAALSSIRDKVDINIYFATDAPEEDILALQGSLELLPQVSSITYVSREQALEDFRIRHANDQSILEALDGVEANPLGAALNVKATDPSQYASIASFLEAESALLVDDVPIIDKVNFNDNRLVIERLTKIIDGVKTMGTVIIVTLVLISIFITFNTIRLVIYISRKEIGVMKLVGAESRYIRGPFVVQGIMYGIIAALLVVALLYPLTLWIEKTTTSFYGGIDLLSYYLGNFGQVAFIIFISGILLGGIASFLAVRRYLKDAA